MKGTMILILLFSVSFAEPIPAGERAGLPQERLTRDMMRSEGYTRYVRPVYNNSQPINVRIRMNLYQLLEVNEPNQNVRLYVWMTQYWTDELLGWNPDEYGGISMTVLPHDAVWLPDTILYNSLQVSRIEAERWISVILNTKNVSATNRTLTGYPTNLNASLHRESSSTNQTNFVADVIFQYPAIYSFTCKMNILFFPFDKQKCTLVFGSWTHSAAGIDYHLYNSNVTFESFVENEEWTITEFTWKRQVVKYACCADTWTLLEAQLFMKRKPLYYITNLITPTAIISIIAIFGFFMPGSTGGERTEKVNMGLTTLLAMSILLLTVSDQMPNTSDYVPLMGWYFLSIIFLISGGTFTTCTIILVQKRAALGKPVSTCFQKLFFSCIARALCVSPPRGLRREKTPANRMVARDKAVINGRTNPLNNQEVSRLIQSNRLSGENGGWNSSSSTPSHALNKSRTHFVHVSKDQDWKDLSCMELEPLRDSAISPDFGSTPKSRKFSNKMELATQSMKEYIVGSEGSEEQDQINLQWEFLAAILDRLFLIFFLLGILSTTFGFFSLGYFSDSFEY